MVCIDTSSMIAFLQGEHGPDVDWVDHALADQVGVFAPVVITELLSDPHLPVSIRNVIVEIPVLTLGDGFWQRAGLLGAKILGTGRKAKLADTLVAQCCLDHGVSLIARDADYQIFTNLAGLKLL